MAGEGLADQQHREDEERGGEHRVAPRLYEHRGAHALSFRSKASISAMSVSLSASRSARCAISGLTRPPNRRLTNRSEEQTSELQSLMRISYAEFFLNKKTTNCLTVKNSISKTTLVRIR